MTDFNPNSIDAVLARIEQKVDTLIKHKNDHEGRITRLEAWKWKVVGIAIGAGMAWEVIKNLFGNGK